MAIRVYLADDHAIVRDGLKSLLETRGNAEVVGAAANGRDAVADIVELRPDVAVMDIAMPTLNGIDATQQVKAQCPGTKVLMLSMHGTPEHIFRALQAGADGYLLKRSAGQELLAAVKTVHSGRRYLGERVADVVVADYLRWGDGAADASPLEGLSEREREILQLLADGKSNAEIAPLLSLSPKTVHTYRSRMMKKLGFKDSVALVKFAVEHGLTPGA